MWVQWYIDNGKTYDVDTMIDLIDCRIEYEANFERMLENPGNKRLIYKEHQLNAKEEYLRAKLGIDQNFNWIGERIKRRKKGYLGHIGGNKKTRRQWELNQG